MSSSSIRIDLTAEGLKRLVRPVSGSGGFQSLIRSIQASVDRGRQCVELRNRQVERIEAYVTKYGRGGFQGQLDEVLAGLQAARETRGGGVGSGAASAIGRHEFEFRPRPPVGVLATEMERAAGTHAVELRHNRVQRELYDRLAGVYGRDRVGVEIPNGIGGRIDVVVATETGFAFYEVKVGVSARQAIREAVGQLLEYTFWPGTRRAERLVVVGEMELDGAGEEYLRRLRDDVGLGLEYECGRGRDG